MAAAITYRKTQQGEWVAYGPASVMRTGGVTVTTAVALVVEPSTFPGLTMPTVKVPLPVPDPFVTCTHGWSAEADHATAAAPVKLTVTVWAAVIGLNVPFVFVPAKRRDWGATLRTGAGNTTRLAVPVAGA